jgi:hypothetical protein
MFGLSSSNDTNGSNYKEIDYAIYFTASKIGIYEKGASKGNNYTSYLTTDVLSVERNDRQNHHH